MTKHRLNDGRDLRRGSISGSQPGESLDHLTHQSEVIDALERKNRMRAARGRDPVSSVKPRPNRERFKPLPEHRKEKPAKALRDSRSEPLRVPPPIEEWDNPYRKRRLAQWERDHFRAVRKARESAASDPDNPVDRAAIIRRDDKTCWVCKKRLELKEIELDHVIPIVRGGKHVPENLRVSCRSCNAWHGDRLIQPL